jgi:hypothetical protein
MMSTERIMQGVANFSGQQVNSLRIGPMASRRPEPRYEVECAVCGVKFLETQARIRSGAARCLSSDCGKAGLREQLADNPRRMREREEQRDRELRREQEERQAAKLAEAQEVLKATANKIALTTRDTILRGRDADVLISPELANASMSRADAANFNREQAAFFVSDTPEYEAYRTPENLEAIGAYFERNGIRIADAKMIRAAFVRLREYGILTPRPAPVVEPAPVPQPRRDVNLTVTREEPKQSTGPRVYVGRDWETGAERQFTEREVNRMSSAEYARAFPVAPTFRDWFIAAGEQRQQK